MSSDEHDEFDALDPAELPHQEFQRVHQLMNVADATRPGKSFRYVAEPCEKHSVKPPGEQLWVEGSPVDPTTGLQQKKRDPNGFMHGCAACEANATVIQEG